MASTRFFDETTEQSQAKAAIVSKYFWAWAKVIIPTAKLNNSNIAYIDLFAGPGRYRDGAKSTPLLVLEKAIENQDMRRMLVTIFNDVDANRSKTLEREIKSIPGIDSLTHAPVVFNQEVGTEIVKMFEQVHLVPTLFFVDPWGYRGLSLRLINSVLKDWGCDCIFFFNFNRVNMGLSNLMVKEHMDALFGEKRADDLRARLNGMHSGERELAIVEEIAEALKEMGGKYVLPFRFKNERGTRTSHHLVFVSKHFKGYEIMKEIMVKESSKDVQGVASFEYNPADRRTPLLFELARPLDDLSDMLLRDFSGQTLTVREIYQRHNIGLPFVLKNYKDVLRILESQDKVSANPSAKNRPIRNGEVTLADKVEILFP